MEHSPEELRADLEDIRFEMLRSELSARFTYNCPFEFTGTIDKLTYNLGPSQLSAEDQKKVDDAMARVNN